MKTRIGFVSNSSSCSFIVYKRDLTEEQISLVENFEDTYAKECVRLNSEFEEGDTCYRYEPEDIAGWRMRNDKDKYVFSTIIDNADLIQAFTRNDIKVSEITDYARFFDGDDY
jgi:hypothetical protein